MKKGFNLIFCSVIILAMLTLTACSSASPEKTVKEFCDATKVFDLKTMASKIDGADDSEEIDLTSLTGEEDQLTGLLLDYIKENLSKMTYTVEETKVDGDEATVVVNFNYVDSTPLIKSVITDVFTKSLSSLFSGVEMTDEEMNNTFKASLEEQRAVVETELIDKKVEFSCVKKDNKWMIEDLNDDMINVITSNIYEVANDMSSMGTE
ncbi:MAG: hypothetical protein ACK5MV_10130 [Aminipila sp.]